MLPPRLAIRHKTQAEELRHGKTKKKTRARSLLSMKRGPLLVNFNREDVTQSCQCVASVPPSPLCEPLRPGQSKTL